MGASIFCVSGSSRSTGEVSPRLARQRVDRELSRGLRAGRMASATTRGSCERRAGDVVRNSSRHAWRGVVAMMVGVFAAGGSMSGVAAQTKPADSVASNALPTYTIADWTAVPAVPTVTTVTVTSVGSCTCDLTAGSCDGNCCCDTDCTVRKHFIPPLFCSPTIQNVALAATANAPTCPPPPTVALQDVLVHNLSATPRSKRASYRPAALPFLPASHSSFYFQRQLRVCCEALLAPRV